MGNPRFRDPAGFYQSPRGMGLDGFTYFYTRNCHLFPPPSREAHGQRNRLKGKIQGCGTSPWDFMKKKLWNKPGFWISWAAIAGLIAIFAFGFSTDPKKVPSPLIGKPAPDFLVKQLDGNQQFRLDRKSTRLNSSHSQQSRMPSSA